MALADRADASVIAAFGESVTYEQPGKDVATVSAVVRSGDLIGEAGILAEVFILKSALTFVPAQRDRITVGSTIYKVAEVLRDGPTAYRLRCQFVQNIIG